MRGKIVENHHHEAVEDEMRQMPEISPVETIVNTTNIIVFVELGHFVREGHPQYRLGDGGSFAPAIFCSPKYRMLYHAGRSASRSKRVFLAVSGDEPCWSLCVPTERRPSTVQGQTFVDRQNHGIPRIVFHHDHPRYNDPGSVISRSNRFPAQP
jgi:hypothetical protein